MLWGMGTATGLRDDLRRSWRRSGSGRLPERRRDPAWVPRLARQAGRQAELVPPPRLRRRRHALEGDARRPDRRADQGRAGDAGWAWSGSSAIRPYGFLVPAMDEICGDGYFAHGPARRLQRLPRMGQHGDLRPLVAGRRLVGGQRPSSEREEDQWTSLTSTPLTGLEILRAKMIGPVWGLRLVAYLMFLLWVVGLAVGSIHPFGVAGLPDRVRRLHLVPDRARDLLLAPVQEQHEGPGLDDGPADLPQRRLHVLLHPVPARHPGDRAGSTPFVFAVSLVSVGGFQRPDTRLQHQTGEMIAACVLGVWPTGSPPPA